MVVLPTMILSSASCTICSDCKSRALVASSSRSIVGFLMMALAIAILCFCPPDSCTPRSPHSVSYPSFNALHDSMSSDYLNKLKS
ncbi:hypothetical protein ACHQM5_028852 [Ranunculus cassubicifolius]